MASRLLPPLRSPGFLGLALGSAGMTGCLLRPSAFQPLYLDSRTASSPTAPGKWSYSQNAQTPVLKNGRPNPSAYRQMSSGSILGLVAGLGVSLFSKSLAFLLGLVLFGLQFAASRGIHIIPYKRLQKYFQHIDLRSTVEDNVAFKLSFAATFALAALAPM